MFKYVIDGNVCFVNLSQISTIEIIDESICIDMIGECSDLSTLIPIKYKDAFLNALGNYVDIFEGE